MNNDLISRKALKRAMQTEIANVPQPDTDADYYVGVKQGLKLAETIINNAPTVSSEITEKQAILLLINNGWLVNHDKELREKWERPQGKCENCDLYFRAMTKEEMRKAVQSND